MKYDDYKDDDDDGPAMPGLTWLLISVIIIILGLSIFVGLGFLILSFLKVYFL